MSLCSPRKCRLNQKEEAEDWEDTFHLHRWHCSFSCECKTMRSVSDRLMLLHLCLGLFIGGVVLPAWEPVEIPTHDANPLRWLLLLMGVFAANEQNKNQREREATNHA